MYAQGTLSKLLQFTFASDKLNSLHVVITKERTCSSLFFCYLFFLAGRIVLELFSDVCPKTCSNFVKLCNGRFQSSFIMFKSLADWLKFLSMLLYGYVFKYIFYVKCTHYKYNVVTFMFKCNHSRGIQVTYWKGCWVYYLWIANLNWIALYQISTELLKPRSTGSLGWIYLFVLWAWLHAPTILFCDVNTCASWELKISVLDVVVTTRHFHNKWIGVIEISVNSCPIVSLFMQ